MADRMKRDNRARTTGDARGGADVQGRQIFRLDDLDDYKVADGQPDPRGWTVKTADGREVGEVDSLIVDTGAMEVRYLDIEAKHEVLGTDDDRHLLVPIGAARLDDDDDVVHLGQLPGTGLRGAPVYSHAAPLTEEDEQQVHAFYGTNSAQREDHSRFFGSRRQGRDDARFLTRSEEELAVGKRPVKAGEVTVEKHVETQHVKKEVPVMREEVTVERRPIAPGTPAGGEINARNNEIRVPVMEEEVVVDKRTVPKEEIVVSKHAVRDTKTVEADLKKEKVDIDRERNREGRSDR